MLEMLEDSPEVKKAIVDNIEKLEKERKFDTHVNPIDYSNCIPVDENYKFIRKGVKNNLKKFHYNNVLNAVKREAQKTLKIKVVGKENLKGLRGGAIVTSNHFNKIDSFAARKALGKVNIVAGDFNNFKGIVGDIMRYTGLLPLSSKQSVMKKFSESISYHLNKKRYVLVYPEQAMWWNYEKPRPLHVGAFHWAVKNNVPVIPCFTTFRESGKLDKDGYPIKFWTVHILPPIYIDDSLSDKQNMNYMMDKNFEEWKECYETFYGKKLKYND